MLCLKCHAISGAGGQVGPDLTSIGASAQVDYLIDSLLLPNKAIKEGFHSLVITTKGGRLVTGIKVRETPAELVLRDAEDREVVIPTKQIDERSNGKSLMPDGLVDALTRAELVDLVRFLSELGKAGPYAASKARVARTWQVLEATPEARAILERTPEGAVSADPVMRWQPAYSQVNGVLPLEGLPAFQFTASPATATVVRCRLDVSTPGPVRLELNSAEGVSLFLNQNLRHAGPSLGWEMPAGVHTITLVIDRSRRREGVRIQLEEVPGSSARVNWVVGK
jgi:putative heme-binding domain-containing protein